MLLLLLGGCGNNRACRRRCCCCCCYCCSCRGRAVVGLVKRLAAPLINPRVLFSLFLSVTYPRVIIPSFSLSPLSIDSSGCFCGLY